MARSRRWFLLLRAAVFMVVFLPAWARPVATWRMVDEDLHRIDWQAVTLAAWSAAAGSLLTFAFFALAIRAFCRALVRA